MLTSCCRFLMQTALFASFLLLTACECESAIPVSNWCDDQHDRCKGLKAYEPALEALSAECPDSQADLIVRSCGDRKLLIKGDGFVGRTLGYDAKGKLIYGSTFTDAIPEGCAPPSGGGEPDAVAEGECSSCFVCGKTFFGEEEEACDPKLAPKLVAACQADAPQELQDACRSCACNECYPVFAPPDSESSAYAGRDFANCVEQRCKSCASG